MDIHRCRFVDYPSSPINAIASSHSSNTAQLHAEARVAVGRGNGDIEIWNPLKGLWLHECTLFGGKDRSIEGLTWTRDPDEVDDNGKSTAGRIRLFSIGSSSSVTEWNLVTGRPLRHTGGNHSEIWCMSAQPPQQRTSSEASTAEPEGHQRIAIGCADGSIILLSTADDDLTFDKYVARPSQRKARVLCMTWKSRDIIAAGFADSSIRVFDLRRRDPYVRTITLGGGPSGGKKEKLVWALESLPDGTLVSGDSTGEVCWWHPQTYGQVHRIKAHEADVLCLARSTNGKTIFSGGMDRRTVTYSNHYDQERGVKRWAKISHQRVHKYDVKTMTSFDTKDISVILSGGPDAGLVITPSEPRRDENFRRLPAIPQRQPLACARRLFVSWWNRQATVWRVRERHSHTEAGMEDVWQDSYTVIARLGLKGDENITCASLSSSGDLIAISTAAETKLFRLDIGADAGAPSKISKLTTPKKFANTGAKIVQFTPDCKWLVLVDDRNEPTMYNLDRIDNSLRISETPQRLERTRRQLHSQSHTKRPLEIYLRRISQVAFSSDSKILAVADLSGRIDTWQLQHDIEQVNGKHHALHQTSSKSSRSSDASESASDDENVDSLGKAKNKIRWKPTKSALPTSHSPAIVLSFCPATSDHMPEKAGAPNGVNADPEVESSLSACDQLLVVTALHEVLEYSVNEGRLTSWSRRNPSATLPVQLRAQLDRATGCIWDCDPKFPEQKKRVWIHGSTWLSMLDMNQDLPIPEDMEKQERDNTSLALTSLSKSRKRKRDQELQEAIQSRRRTAGAGSKKLNDEVHTASTETIQNIDKSEQEQADDAESLVNGVRPDRQVETESDGDDNNNEVTIALAKQRRREGPDTDVDTDQKQLVNGDHEAALSMKVDAKERPPFYMTLKYRPILGIVPLMNDGEAQLNDDAAGHVSAPQRPRRARTLEVALIERPVEDLDLPAKFHGGQNWHR